MVVGLGQKTKGVAMYEAVEFTDAGPTSADPTPAQVVLGEFESFDDAVAAARAAREEHGTDSASSTYRWWLVRKPGAQLAEWIADSRNDKEFMLDVRTGQLVEV